MCRGLWVGKAEDFQVRSPNPYASSAPSPKGEGCIEKQGSACALVNPGFSIHLAHPAGFARHSNTRGLVRDECKRLDRRPVRTE